MEEPAVWKLSKMRNANEIISLFFGQWSFRWWGQWCQSFSGGDWMLWSWFLLPFFWFICIASAFFEGWIFPYFSHQIGECVVCESWLLGWLSHPKALKSYHLPNRKVGQQNNKTTIFQGCLLLKFVCCSTKNHREKTCEKQKSSPAP